MEALKWGILGTGGISRQFAGGLSATESGVLTVTGSRTQAAADEFATKYTGVGVEGYQAVLDDPEVQAVYIGLPHHMHSEWTIKCAEAGKGILCEKPFTLTTKEAERALAAVKQHNVFFMEAFMYRCHPQTLLVQKLIEDGRIGELRQINAEFGFNASKDWTGFRGVNELGGGAIMDVGVYPTSLARLLFKEEPTRFEYIASIGKGGYDEEGVGLLGFSEGRSLQFGTAVHLQLKNGAIIYGTEGMITLDNPWKVTPGSKVKLFKGDQLEEEWDLSDTNDMLYAHEADTVAEFFAQKETPRMTIADTIGQMKTLDALRKSAGLYFKGEELR